MHQTSVTIEPPPAGVIGSPADYLHDCTAIGLNMTLRAIGYAGTLFKSDSTVLLLPLPADR